MVAKTTTADSEQVSKSQAERLSEPFPASVIKKVKQGGVELDYIPVAEVIKRMNTVLGPGAWSATCSQIYRDPVDGGWIVAEAVVKAEVDGKAAERSATGAVKIKTFKNTVDPVNLGHDYKGAFSEAVKKACQWFGVGLYLSMPDDEEEWQPPVEDTSPQPARPAQAPPSVVTDEEWKKLLEYMGELDDTQKGIIKEWWTLHGTGDKPTRASITKAQFEELMKRVTVELFNADVVPDGQPF